MRLEDVTTGAVDAWRAQVVNERRLANKTVNKVLAVLHGIFERARKLYGLPANPVAEVEKQPRKHRVNASVAASVYILMPKRALLFSQSGPALYEGLYSVRDDAPEIHRRLAYELYRFWEGNDHRMRNLFHAYRVAAAALVVEILLLVALVSDTLV